MKRIHVSSLKISIMKFLQGLWPVTKNESKLVFVNGALLFCIVFNYSILRNLKDTLINTAATSGPEVTCFIKSWLVLPISILCFVAITKLSNVLSRKAIFYYTSLSFLFFFLIFCFFLYPNQQFVHPSITTITVLQSKYPSLQWLFPIYGIWSYSLFYIVAELWGSIMMGLLFWEYANEITSTTEAKRFYPFFILMANMGLIVAGLYVGRILPISTPGVGFQDPVQWDNALSIILVTVILVGMIAVLLYAWSNVLVQQKHQLQGKYQQQQVVEIIIE